MINIESLTPVVVIGGKLGGLSICRTLGKFNIDVHVFDEDPKCPAFLSRYCRSKTLLNFDQEKPEEYLEHLISFGSRIREKPILIPTSDELSIFVSEFDSILRKYFRFPENKSTLIRNLASKKTMFEVAKANGVPTASAKFPKSIEEVYEYCRTAEFPVMLKGIFGNRLQADSGKKMLIVKSPDELIKEYRTLASYDAGNLMIQEYIPGEDDQVFIFNGYFNENSDCLTAFTGRKIRQFPIHTGCASLGECCWNEDVHQITTRFMKAIGYRGILDIGYRYDMRDGQYKVLDINPRVGQAFRLFTAHNSMDVVRALYLDLTGQSVPRSTPCEGRRWMIEDFDIVSTFHYFKEGSISLGEWIRSFRKLQECMWFDLRDPAPFSNMILNLSKRGFTYISKRALS